MTEGNNNKNPKQSIIISPLAHSKMILHSVRRSRTSIHGILLGKYDDKNFDSTGDSGVLLIVDVIPVSHSAPTKMILDTSLQIADAYCSSSSIAGENNVGIIGWYSSNERVDDDMPGQAALKIVSSMFMKLTSDSLLPFPSAEPILIMITNTGVKEFFTGLTAEDDVSAETNASAVQVYGRDHRKHWLQPYPSTSVSSSLSKNTWSQSNEIAKALCDSDTKCYDFEDQLRSDRSLIDECDWIVNKNVNTFIQKMT